MSKVKKLKVGIIFIISLLSFFMFGCEKSTPVDDIYFNLADGEQIVLVVGQTFEIDDFVSVKPNYASNKKFEIISLDETIIEIQNNKLIAKGEGSAQIKVVADDNSIKQDLMTVVVNKSKTTLLTPKNLKYNELLNQLTFDSVPYASSYTVRINNEEKNIGNSTIVDLNQFSGIYNKLLDVQIKANAPTYTYALESSQFSSGYQMYIAGIVSEVKVENGVLSFTKSSSALTSNIYIGDELIIEKSANSQFALTDLNEKFAGVNTELKIKTIVTDEIKSEFGANVNYYDSKEISTRLSVLDVPNIEINHSTLSWQHIPYCVGYKVFIDGIEKAETKTNYFNLEELADYNTVISAGTIHSVKVIPYLDATVKNVGKTSKVDSVKVSRLNTPTISCNGTNVQWLPITNATNYSLSLVCEDENNIVNLETSLTSTSLSMLSYKAGNYKIEVQAVLSEFVDDVYYLSSEKEDLEFKKLPAIEAVIKDYHLKIKNFGEDFCDIAFINTPNLSELKVGENADVNIDLSLENFASGNQPIVLIRKNSGCIDSDPFTVSFVQLEAVSAININNGVASIARSSTNLNATIKLTTQNKNTSEVLSVEQDSIKYNTTDSTKTDITKPDYCLQAGEYAVSVEVIGDGSATFSYREGVVVKPHAEKTFTVLSAPTLSSKSSNESALMIEGGDGAVSFNIELIQSSKVTKNSQYREFALSNFGGISAGETKKFKAQAVGNGSTTLDSAYGTEISVSRLKTPSLKFNNTNNTISIVDSNDVVNTVDGYKYTVNSEEQDFETFDDYDWTKNQSLTLSSLAEYEYNGVYYLDSDTFNLNLTKISNFANISMDANNNLKINVPEHSEEYDLEVVFNLTSGTKTFRTNGEVLTDGITELSYSYSSKNYIVTLVNDFNAIIPEMNDGFAVKVRFIKPTNPTDGDADINSEYTPVVENLNFTKLDNTTTIYVNNENKLVVEAMNLTRQYGLVVVLNDSITFKSNGSQLESDDGNLNFTYDQSSRSYYIDFINDEFNHCLDITKTNFTIKVQYKCKLNAEDRDLDSEFSETYQNLTFAHIDNTTIFNVDSNNKLVITPTNATKQYGLVLTINNSLVFKTNGSKLVSAAGELNFTYNPTSKSYYIDLLDNEYNHYIETFNSNFKVKVQYKHNLNAEDRDLDSVETENKDIEVLPSTDLLRENQNLKFTNVKPTYTYQNYGLLVNDNPNLVRFGESDIVIAEGVATFAADFIYNNTPSVYLKDINDVSVVVCNVLSSQDVPQLSSKGATIQVQRANTVALSYEKDNDAVDNSAIVKFSSYVSTYEKQYVVEFHVESAKVYEITYENTLSDNAEINLDEVVEHLTYEKGLNFSSLSIKAYCKSNYSNETLNPRYYAFDSVYSNELTFTKVNSVSGLRVSNSSILFNSATNAVGYEIYQKTGTSYTKLNSELITSTSYEFTNITGLTELVVKSISKEIGNFTNSVYSEVIKINKVEQQNVKVENGKFKIELSDDIMSLLNKTELNVYLDITTHQGEVKSIDLNNITSANMSLNENVLTVLPEEFLGYNTQSILKETIKAKVRFEYSNPIDGVYYLNSNISNIDAYGLISATNVKKVVEDGDVEFISWTPSDKNIVDGNALNVGYIVKFVYNDIPYFTNNEDLKYYNKSTGKYVSYPSIITTTSIVFPAGYGGNENGVAVKFEAGTYDVCVQTIPNSAGSSYNICDSKFSATCNFEILSSVNLITSNGKVVWNKIEKTNKYQISVYDSANALAISETIELSGAETPAEYDFTNSTFDNYSGVLKVVIKALGARDDLLNSADSEPLYVYRIPKATNVRIDDGNLILTATKYFKTANIELIDSISNTVHNLTYDNSTLLEQSLNGLSITSWQNFTNNTEINATKDFAINVYGEAINIFDGRDYKINVTLIGNTSDKLGVITSAKAVEIAALSATKLKTSVNNSSVGGLKFMPDNKYAGKNLNYSFNGEESTAFWKQTTIYKINLTTIEEDYEIYAVDYYSFINAISSPVVLAETEYEILDQDDGLYAYIKYNYDGGTLKFNVYKDNTINLRDANQISYYAINKVVNNGFGTLKEIKNTQPGAIDGRFSIDLKHGGLFTFNVSILGGDDYNNGTLQVGYLSSNYGDSEKFVKYGEHTKETISTFEGLVQFEDARKVKDNKGDFVDAPVYRINVQRKNGSAQIFYLYYQNLEEALKIADLHNNEDETAIFEQITINSNGKLLFDASKFVDLGSYNISIRTLAELTAHLTDIGILISAKEPTDAPTFNKLSNTQFTANDGVLQFNRAYIDIDNVPSYTDNYEITLFNKNNNATYVYKIDSSNQDLIVNTESNIVQYILPSQITVNNQPIAITENNEYHIKVRAISNEEGVLNGTYIKDGENELVYKFKKALGCSLVTVEDGKLKFKVVDEANYMRPIIKVSFLDANNELQTITIKESNKYEEDGVYQYHYYDFNTYDTTTLDYLPSTILYNLGDGSTEERPVNYTISVSVSGIQNQDLYVINSNLVEVKNIYRLPEVDKSSVKTVDGNLTWLASANAKGYEVVISNTSLGVRETLYTSVNTLNVQNELNLLGGNYSVNIRAVGENKYISSKFWSDELKDYVQLSKVDTGTVKLSGRVVSWQAVDNADGYKVKVSYNGTQTVEKVVTSTLFALDSTNGIGNINGTFTIEISAVSNGEGKEFNSDPITYNCNTEAPNAVTEFMFDKENSRIVVAVAEDFTSSDTVFVKYDFIEYTEGENLATVNKIVTITYQQAEYYQPQSGVYYIPLSKMGIYKNLSAYVERPVVGVVNNTISSNVVSITQDEILDLFKCGDGTTQNPYRIANYKHLLNISYFPSANFKFYQSVDLTSVINGTAEDGYNLSERLLKYGALITDNFNGTIDGNNLNIEGDNTKDLHIELNGITNFALFGTIVGKEDVVTIKNLNIGSSNFATVISNTFANDSQNVVELSLIATNANNVIIENVKLLNVQFNYIQQTETNSANEIYIGGMFVNTTNSTIKNSIVNVAVNMNSSFKADKVYVGGVSSLMTATTVEGTDAENSAKIDFALNTSASNYLHYVGGVAGRYEGVSARSNHIEFVDVKFNTTNVNANYVGGIVGLGKFAIINNCKILDNSTISYIGLDKTTYIGGVIGYAQSSIVSNTVSNVTFNVTFNGVSNKYIGAIAGYLSRIASSNVSCEMINCSSDKYSNGQTSSDLSTIRLYGYKGENVTT